MTGLNVNLGERSYKIYVSPAFNNLLNILSSYKLSKALLVTDSNVGRLHSEECTEQIKHAGIEVVNFVFPAGEASKNLKTVEDIYKICKDNKFERNDAIIALGGGVVGDLAGFAAATYLRGINFIQLPTSVIAQCDSSVGGKVGVDFEGGKNLVGAFYQPKTVYINVDTLKTLPEREYISGFAEVIKHGVIQDAEFFRYLEENVDGIQARNNDVLAYVVRSNCSIKAKVVELDERENYLRAILNFGHTVGHAIESVLEFSLLHGECVALGIVAACSISRTMGLINEEDMGRIVALLQKIKLPTMHEGLNVQKVYDQMLFDKKISGGKVNFILPKRIGEVVQCNEVNENTIKDSIQRLLL